MDATARSPEEALKPHRPRRRNPLRFAPWLPGNAWGDVMEPRPMGGRFRAVRRIAAAALWTAVAVPIQVVLVGLPGQAKVGFARSYHRVLCRLIGLRINIVGRPAEGPSVLFVSNHSSWLDILVLGAILEAAFVSKAEVRDWPVVSTVARLGRTVFVSRKRGATGREADEIRQRLREGHSIVLFPEGTSSDGTRVLPFRSSFFGVARDARQVQPVSLVYDRLGGLPACRRDRPFFAWYGDMDIATHFWRIARRAGARATILLHEPLDPAAFADRKGLTQVAGQVVAQGASVLRQNRPAISLPPAGNGGG